MTIRYIQGGLFHSHTLLKHPRSFLNIRVPFQSKILFEYPRSSLIIRDPLRISKILFGCPRSSSYIRDPLLISKIIFEYEILFKSIKIFKNVPKKSNLRFRCFAWCVGHMVGFLEKITNLLFLPHFLACKAPFPCPSIEHPDHLPHSSGNFYPPNHEKWEKLIRLQEVSFQNKKFIGTKWNPWAEV